MSLPMTPESLAAAYDYLKTTPPFSKWNLPDSEDVLFKVGKYRTDYASYRWDGKQHTISMSANAIGHTVTLFRYLAHEMIHLHLEETGMESRTGGKDTHNAAFRKFAASVCRYHGFDVKAFY
jgi:hypothetical protein